MPDTPTPWIFTKSRLYPPDGSLRLGQILSEPRNPLSQLVVRKGRLIPARIQVNKSCSDLKLQKSEELENRFKAWAKMFGRPFGLSGEAKTTYKWEENWSFEELHGEVMPFDFAYGEEALKDDNVRRYIESQFYATKYWKSLYMVTGVRWAKGAKLQSNKSKTSEFQASGEGDLTPAKVPVRVGAEAGRKKAKAQKESFEKATDFVFQYCLQKIKYSGKFKAKPYTHGATEADEDEEPVAPGPTEIESLTFIGLGEAVEVEILPEDLEEQEEEPESLEPDEGNEASPPSGLRQPGTLADEARPGDNDAAVRRGNSGEDEGDRQTTWVNWGLTKLRELWRSLGLWSAYDWLLGVIWRR